MQPHVPNGPTKAAAKQPAPAPEPPHIDVVSVAVVRAPRFTREDLLALSNATDKISSMGASEGPIRFALEHWMEFQDNRLRQNEFPDETAAKLSAADEGTPTETLRVAQGAAGYKPIDERALEKDITLLKEKKSVLAAVLGADRNLDFDRTRDVFVVKLRVANKSVQPLTFVSGRFDVADSAGKALVNVDLENTTTVAAGGSVEIEGTIPFRVNAAHLVALETNLAGAKWTFKADRTVYGK